MYVVFAPIVTAAFNFGAAFGTGNSVVGGVAADAEFVMSLGAPESEIADDGVANESTGCALGWFVVDGVLDDADEVPVEVVLVEVVLVDILPAATGGSPMMGLMRGFFPGRALFWNHCLKRCCIVSHLSML